jgi:hypothetical protein
VPDLLFQRRLPAGQSRSLRGAGQVRPPHKEP